MDAQKVLENQYITVETLYKTYIREKNDVLKLSTRQMSSDQQKKKKLSGTSRMFRGASTVESQESKMTEPVDCVEDGVLNEFEMMWYLRILFPLHFFVFKQTVSHLTEGT